jgi:hypothetical protein
MSKHQDRGQQFSGELEPVVSRLLDKSAYTDPLDLDLRKQRLMARLNPRGGRRTYMRSRIATVLAIMGLLGGSGGAFALASSGSNGSTGGPAFGQYGGHHRCKKHHEEKKHGKCDRGHDKKHDH